MLRNMKAQAIPTVLLIGEIGLAGFQRAPEWLVGVLIGGTLFWLVWSVVFDKGLSNRFPRWVEWLPFLDPHQEGLTKADLHGNVLSGKTFRIVDLATDGGIHGRTFEDCTIHGPAVLAPSNYAAFYDCEYTCPPERFYWVRDSEPSKKSIEPLPDGHLVVGKCIFRRCRFINIGVIGTADNVQRMRETVTFVGEPSNALKGAS